MNEPILTKLATRESELNGILSLQQRNLRRHLSDAEAEAQGFLIAEFTADYLRAMNAVRPSVVAMDGDRVVGYAVVATRASRTGDPLLAALFDQIDPLIFNGRCLSDTSYVVVGQLCVDKLYRGRGLVGQLYGLFRESLEGDYDCAVTEVAKANGRSLQAHRRVGFQAIHSIEYEQLEWEIVLWDWKRRANG
jgi:L-amino acid N-acyltransferase YncA